MVQWVQRSRFTEEEGRSRSLLTLLACSPVAKSDDLKFA